MDDSWQRRPERTRASVTGSRRRRRRRWSSPSRKRRHGAGLAWRETRPREGRHWSDRWTRALAESGRLRSRGHARTELRAPPIFQEGLQPSQESGKVRAPVRPTHPGEPPIDTGPEKPTVPPRGARNAQTLRGPAARCRPRKRELRRCRGFRQAAPKRPSRVPPCPKVTRVSGTNASHGRHAGRDHFLDGGQHGGLSALPIAEKMGCDFVAGRRTRLRSVAAWSRRSARSGSGSSVFAGSRHSRGPARRWRRRSVLTPAAGWASLTRPCSPSPWMHARAEVAQILVHRWWK